METVQENIDLIHRFFNFPFEEKRIEACYREMLSEDAVLHGPTTGYEERGLFRLTEIDKELSKICKNIHRHINEICAVQDKVIVYWTVYGVHCYGENEGKNMVVSGHGIYRIKEGKICEIWQTWDKMSFLKQMDKLDIHLNEISSEPTPLFLKVLGFETYAKVASTLSERERECLKLLLQGKTAKETAVILSLSFRTIESYFENIKNKFNCVNKRDLFDIAQILDKLALL